MKKIVMVFKILKHQAPAHLYDLFQYVHETSSINTRSSFTDLKVPKLVGSEIAETKLSYSRAMLFNSLPKLFKRHKQQHSVLIQNTFDYVFPPAK